MPLESNLVAHCTRCGWALSFRPLKVTVRPKERGENATHIEIWDSGCKCGESRFEELGTRKKPVVKGVL